MSAEGLAMSPGRKVFSSRSNLETGIVEGLLATPFVLVGVPGSFVVVALLTRYFHIEKDVLGWIVSIPSWSHAAQIFAIPVLARFLSAKDLTLGMAWFNAGLWAMLALSLGILPRDQPAVVALFFTGFFLMASPTQAFHGVGWTAWLLDWVPQRVRGGYMGNRNRWIAVVTVGFLLFTSLLFEMGRDGLWPYLVLIAAAVALRFAGLLRLQTIKARGENRPVEGVRFSEALRTCLQTPGLLRFIAFSAWMNFWMAFTGPFTAVFCFEQLGIKTAEFSLLMTLGTVTGIAGWVFWGRAADKAGSVPVLIVGAALWECQQLLWAVVTPSTAWMLYPMHLWGGFFAVSFFIGGFNLLLNLAPKQSGIATMSLHIAATAAASALAPILAGSLLEEFVARRGAGIEAYHVGYAIKSAAFLLGLLLLAGIREPGKSSLTSLPGAFRSIREQLAVQGLEFLANLAPFRSDRATKKNRARRK
jgi:hypothetical protein